MSRQLITNVFGLLALLLLIFPVSGMASYAAPNGPQINADHIQNVLLMHPRPVAASEVRLVVEQSGQPSWDSGEWNIRSARSITLAEWSRLTPLTSLLLAVLALATKRWRYWLLSASAAVILLVLFAATTLNWLPPYKSFNYLAEFLPAPSASYPGAADALLLYEKPDLRPRSPTKAVVFCDGMAGRLSMDEIQAALEAQRIARTEDLFAPDSHSSGR